MLTLISPSASKVTLAQCIELLEMRRQFLGEEIRHYARPVQACDADFNALLAEQAEVSAAISNLLPLCRGEARIPHPREDQPFH